MSPNRRARAIVVGTILAMTVALFSVEYTVERGDTLGRIARDNKVSLADLVAINNIDNPNLIYPGQVLVIPGEQDQPDIVHVVARGETLVRIAGTYGASALAVARANGLVHPNLIYPGQKLVIPGDGTTSSSPSTSPAPSSDGESEGSTDKTPSTSRSGKFHVVKAGETLESIAKQYSGVSAAAIAEANGVVNGKVYTGTRLFLDGPSYTAGGGSGDGTYVVKSGDRLGDIAAHYGTTLSAIAKLNGISNVNLIRSGQSLTIPGASGWVCPVSSPSYFNDWGFPRSGSRFHEGNDLFTKYGSPVKAPISGTVELKTGSLGGLQFNLHGSDGVEYLGSHLSASEKIGKVSAGDVIGYVGTSGNAQGTSPHLHFGMYIDGLAINPYPTLIANDC